jgi:hypothetical protein
MVETTLFAGSGGRRTVASEPVHQLATDIAAQSPAKQARRAAIRATRPGPREVTLQ